MSNIHKDEIDTLNALFIAAPREMTSVRFTQIVKRYLPKANIIIGISKEKYVVGFENQPQFTMLRRESIQDIVNKVAASHSPHKVYVYEYSQSNFASILDQHHFQRVLLVNGSWKYAFHNSDAFKILLDKKVDFKYISPFATETEALDYANAKTPVISFPKTGTTLTKAEMMTLADKAAIQSFDYSFQTGVALGRKSKDGYEYIETAFNEVIPYQTYALHHGNSREKNLSRPHDTNHYDTIHAEMQLLTKALENNINLSGSTLFVNLLPCPNCARTLSKTAISEFIYRNDHSNGYAVELLEASGKIIRRISDKELTL